jgi:hypothetical protein
VCVCAFGSLSSNNNASDVPITGHIEGRGPTTGSHTARAHNARHTTTIMAAACIVHVCVCVCVSCCEAAVRGGRVEIRAAATRAAGTHLPTICCCCVCVCVCVCVCIHTHTHTHTHTHVVKYRTRLRNAHFVRCPPLVRCSSLCPAHQPTLRAITTTTMMMMMMMMRRRGSVHGCVHDCMLTTCVCV